MLGTRRNGPVLVPPVGLEVGYAHGGLAVEREDAFDAAAVGVLRAPHHRAFQAHHHRRHAHAVTEQRLERIGVGHRAAGVVCRGKPKLGNAPVWRRRIAGLGADGPGLDVAC